MISNNQLDEQEPNVHPNQQNSLDCEEDPATKPNSNLDCSNFLNQFQTPGPDSPYLSAENQGLRRSQSFNHHRFPSTGNTRGQTGNGSNAMPRGNWGNYHNQQGQYNQRYSGRPHRNSYSLDESMSVENQESPNEVPVGNSYYDNRGCSGGSNGYRGYKSRRYSQPNTYRGNCLPRDNRVFTYSDNSSPTVLMSGVYDNNPRCSQGSGFENHIQVPDFTGVDGENVAKPLYTENVGSHGDDLYAAHATNYISPTNGSGSTAQVFRGPVSMMPGRNIPSNNNCSVMPTPPRAPGNNGGGDAADVPTEICNRLEDFPSLSSTVRCKTNGSSRYTGAKQKSESHSKAMPSKQHQKQTDNTPNEFSDLSRQQQLHHQQQNSQLQHEHQQQIEYENAAEKQLLSLHIPLQQQQQQQQLCHLHAQQQAMQQANQAHPNSEMPQTFSQQLQQKCQQPTPHNQTTNPHACWQRMQQSANQHQNYQPPYQQNMQRNFPQMLQQLTPQQQQQVYQQQLQQQFLQQQQQQLFQQQQRFQNEWQRQWPQQQLQCQQQLHQFHLQQLHQQQLQQNQYLQYQHQQQQQKQQQQQQQHILQQHVAGQQRNVQQNLNAVQQNPPSTQEQIQEQKTTNHQQQPTIPNEMPSNQKQAAQSSKPQEPQQNFEVAPKKQQEKTPRTYAIQFADLLKLHADNEQSSGRRIQPSTKKNSYKHSFHPKQHQQKKSKKSPQHHGSSQKSKAKNQHPEEYPELPQKKKGKTQAKSQQRETAPRTASPVKFKDSQCQTQTLNWHELPSVEMMDKSQQTDELQSQNPTSKVRTSQNEREPMQKVAVKNQLGKDDAHQRKPHSVHAQAAIKQPSPLAPQKRERSTSRCYAKLPESTYSLPKKQPQASSNLVSPCGEMAHQLQMSSSPPTFETQQESKSKQQSVFSTTAQTSEMPESDEQRPKKQPVFEMRNEDFPALSSLNCQKPCSSTSAKTSANLQEKKRPIIDAKDVKTFLANFEKRHKEQKERELRESRSTYKPPKEPMKVWPNGMVTNIPSTMLTDQYGIAGLYSAMKGAQNNSHIAHMLYGIDLDTLGLDLRSKEPILSSFKGPFFGEDLQTFGPTKSESVDSMSSYEKNKSNMRFFLDSEVREMLAPPEMAILSDEDLFYIFYTQVQDILQLQAANELYNRGWAFYIKDRIWLTHDPEATYERSGPFERGDYICYDSIESKCVFRYMRIDTTQIDRRPIIPAIDRDNDITTSSWNTESS